VHCHDGECTKCFQTKLQKGLFHVHGTKSLKNRAHTPSFKMVAAPCQEETHCKIGDPVESCLQCFGEKEFPQRWSSSIA